MNSTFRRSHNTALPIAAFFIVLVAVPVAVHAQMQYTVLHHFNRADGFGPMAGVVQDTSGILYGTTSQGGTSDLGSVFRLAPKTTTFSTIHNFSGPDGSVLYSGLILGIDGLLYGSTYSGGTNNLGTLFSSGTDGQGFSSLWSFTGSPDGAKPDDLKLTQASDGRFYGTTSERGPGGGGTIFQFDPTTSAIGTLSSFSSAGGAGVDAGLMAGGNGVWYGTTYSGGTIGYGSVFSWDGKVVTTLHSFSGTDGANPVPGSLTWSRDGKTLYGTTQQGGGGYGAVFRLNPASGTFTTLHSFSAVNDGRSPLGGVTEGIDGNLYGTTALGGGGYGIVYRINPGTLAYSIIVWFAGANGRMPSGNLLSDGNGALYGTTRVGGTANCGTVFRLVYSDITPPVITTVTATPNVLKSAGGKMVPVTVAVAATDNLDSSPKSKITRISCSEAAPDADMIITGDLTVSLRATRNGRNPRIYTITVQCADASGNSSTGTTIVTVK